jgi:hypothetical protein
MEGSVPLQITTCQTASRTATAAIRCPARLASSALVDVFMMLSQ